jgi:hypothetical protein
VGGGPGSGTRRPRCGRQGETTRRCGGAWGPGLVSGAQTAHDQPALPAVPTVLTGLGRGVLAGGRPARLVWGRARGGRCVARQAAWAAVSQGPRRWTPPPIVPDRGAAAGPPVRPHAAETRLGREGHGGPPLGPGVRLAPAALARGEGEQAGGGPGEARDRAAPVVAPVCRAVHRRVTRDDPVGGPDRRGQGPIGALRGSQGPNPTAAQVRAGPDRPAVRRGRQRAPARRGHPVTGAPRGRRSGRGPERPAPADAWAAAAPHRGASGPQRAWPPWPWCPRTRSRGASMAETGRWVPSVSRRPPAASRRRHLRAVGCLTKARRDRTSHRRPTTGRVGVLRGRTRVPTGHGRVRVRA